MPEEHPLQRLVPLQLILEPKLVLLVCELQEVQHLCGRLDDRKRRGLRVVDQHGDSTVGVQAQEPLFLLLIGHDIDECGGPFCTVAVGKLFKEDLCGLSVGSVLCDEVEAFGFGDLLRSVRDVEIVRHFGKYCRQLSRDRGLVDAIDRVGNSLTSLPQRNLGSCFFG